MNATERLIAFLTGATTTFGLGSLIAIALLFAIRAVAPDAHPAFAVAIAASLGYSAASGWMFMRPASDEPAARALNTPLGTKATRPVEVVMVDEAHDHAILLAGFRSVKARVATHRVLAMRGEASEDFASGYAAAVRDLAQEIVQADRTHPPTVGAR